MGKVFNDKELEILVDLVDEEIEETTQYLKSTDLPTEDIAINQEKLKTLNSIREELETKPYSKDVEMGLAIGTLINSNYIFENIYKFLTHKEDSCYYIDKLRDLYERFDYHLINQIIITIGKEMFEGKNNE